MSNFDEALERFQQVDLEYSGGLANHGPMGAEALLSLGHQAKIPALVDLYAPRLPPLPGGHFLTPSVREAARGGGGQRGDWVVTFETIVVEQDWREVIAREVPPLLPGLFAGAGHGLLRVAHAVRALEREDNAIRRREIAHGLANWSSRFQTLPGAPGSRASEAAVELEEAIQHWPLVGDVGGRSGYFFHLAEGLSGWSPFVDAIDSLVLPEPGSVEAFLGRLCGCAASLYVDHPTDRIAYVHALTIPNAVRALLPYLSPEEGVVAAGHAMQAVGALHSIFGDRSSRPEEDEEVLRVAGDWDEIRYHAACSIQEHSIKMVEACWREDRLTADSIFRRAAADAALKIGGRGEAAQC